MKDKSPGRVLLQGSLKEGLYCLDAPGVVSVSTVNKPLDFVSCKRPSVSFECLSSSVSESSSSLRFWHLCPGHPSLKVLGKVLEQCNLKKSFINENGLLQFCDACQYGKNHVLPFHSSFVKTTRPLELIHTDLWGPSPTLISRGISLLYTLCR